MSMPATDRAAWRTPAVDTERLLRAVLILGACAWLVCAVLLPVVNLLGKSLLDQDGAFVGLANFRTYFGTPSLSRSLWNSVRVALVTTVASVTLGFGYAYGLARTRMPGKAFFRGVAMLPLFAPTLLYGISLVYLFGRKGLITTGFLGFFKTHLGIDVGFDIGVYGEVGITLAEIVYTFPQAFLILSTALRMTDARLFEASDALGASHLRTFFTVTLPGVKYGLVSAFFVCFILCFTDFGAPKVVGGNFPVLATDIYKQVIGQQNFVMGATVAVVLLLPTLVAFLADRVAQRRQVSMIQARSVTFDPAPNRRADRLALAGCGLVALLVVTFFAVSLLASLVSVWPYDLSVSLRHYRFEFTGGGGYGALWNSVRMSLWAALAGTAAAFCSAYLVEKSRGMSGLRQGAYFLSMVPLALPGMVIGLAYIFFFNAPGWDAGGVRLPNPFGGLYGTMAILVLSNVVHFYTVSFLTATTALKQLDQEFETVSESLGVPFWRTFRKVTLPVCLPAVLEIALYFFVNSMATVSAVIFLYSSDIPLASVAVANMDDAGDTAPAAAMSMLVVLVNIAARLAFEVARRLTRGSRAWTRR
jgi:iron(III) transport system permease protein